MDVEKILDNAIDTNYELEDIGIQSDIFKDAAEKALKDYTEEACEQYIAPKKTK